MTSIWPWVAVAGLGGLHGLNPATGWMFAAAWGVRSRPDADRGRARRVDRGRGRRGGARRVDGPRRASGRGVRAARGCRAAPPVAPHGTAGPGARRACRTGAVVVHDVHRARRRADAGAGADPAVHRRRAGPRDHCIRLAGAGPRRDRRPHGGDARRHRCGRHRHLSRRRRLGSPAGPQAGDGYATAAKLSGRAIGQYRRNTACGISPWSNAPGATNGSRLASSCTS